MRKFILGFVSTLMIMSVASVSAATDSNIEVFFNQVRVIIDSKNVNGDNILYNGTTYVPIRNVAESLNKEIQFDAETKTVYIGEILKEDSFDNGRTVPMGMPNKTDDLQITIIKSSYKDLAYELLLDMDIPAEENKNYILSTVQVKNLSNETLDISEDMFEAAGNAKIIKINNPQPAFKRTLKPGEEFTGYIAVETAEEKTVLRVGGKEYEL